MTDRTPIRREVLDTFDVAAQGLHDDDYVGLCREVRIEIERREQGVYARRRRLYESLATSTSGA